MKFSVYIDWRTELLLRHIKPQDEGISIFFQRMVREEAHRQGIDVKTVAEQEKEN